MTTQSHPDAPDPGHGLRLLVETDRKDLVRFLERAPEENIFLLSRIALDGVVNEESTSHGRFYGHYTDEVLDGVVFFGHRKGVVLAGAENGFAKAATDLALGEESDWVILVGPRASADRFLSHYRWRGLPTHLNRIQLFYVSDVVNPAIPPAPVRLAELEDLEDVTEMTERMLLEDFELPRGSLSRDAIRESARLKIEDGRTWVLEDHGEIVFKMDVAAHFSGGAQIEGVFTRPHRRGRGFGRAGVAGVTAKLLESTPFVTLHVNRTNTPARRAYEKAGYHPFSEFRLVLLRGRER